MSVLTLPIVPTAINTIQELSEYPLPVSTYRQLTGLSVSITCLHLQVANRVASIHYLSPLAGSQQCCQYPLPVSTYRQLTGSHYLQVASMVASIHTCLHLQVDNRVASIHYLSPHTGSQHGCQYLLPVSTYRQLSWLSLPASITCPHLQLANWEPVYISCLHLQIANREPVYITCLHLQLSNNVASIKTCLT